MASNFADVYVKLPTGRVTQLDLLPSHQVREIYRRVADEEGVREGQVKIKYTGKVLKKNQTIGYLGICKETILKAEIIALKKINITVTKGDESFSLSLDNVASVANLKESIKAKEGTLPSRQILKHDGVTLTECGMTLADLKVTDGSVVELNSRPEGVPESEESTKKGENNEEDDECTDEQREELMSTFQTDGRNIEVVFSFDTTGSMYPCLTKVRTKLDESVRRLLRDIPNIRIGIMAMGDYCDYNKYVIKMQDLTTDVQQLVTFVNDVPETGGGDAPEAYEWVLHKAQQLDWAEDSAKALVVIGDEIPHAPSYTDQNTNWHEELDILGGMGVKVYGVQALDNSRSTPFYEELAERTGGVRLTLKHFDLITDMFLAVCYKESSPEQLQAHREEVEHEGRMTEEAVDMYKQLEQPKEEKEKERPNEPKRYVAQSWWDPQLDNSSATPKYYYDAATDEWSPHWKVADKTKSTSTTSKAHSSADSRSGSSVGSASRDTGKKSQSVWKKIKRGFSLKRRH